MKKTKIVCTMGPNTNDKNIMLELAKNGMDVARFNFSHGDYAEHQSRLEILKEVRKELDRPVAALLDTKGPEIRTGVLKDGKKVSLKEGQTFTLTTREIIGDETITHINYSGLNEDVAAGNKILIDDGLIELEVEKVEGTEIVCTVINGGELGEKKGVNVPNVKIKLPALTEKDKEDIRFGIKQGFDFIAASFVRTADCIREIKSMLDSEGSAIKVIAKIENAEGIDNLDEIIAVADGIMVARGDMGVEIPAQEVPHIQKEIIRKCNAAYKPVITATQMLDSMMENPRPTRAEITDVANAIYDGTSAIMLSGETAAGKYPVETVKTMNAIALRTEADINHAKRMAMQSSGRGRLSVAAATAHAACTTAQEIGADAIITVSQSGTTARLVSRFHPGTPIIACLLSRQVQRQMALYWGVEPIMMPYVNSTDELVSHAVESAEAAGLVRQGDLVVVTAGVPVGISGTTNMIRVQQVGGALVNAVGVGDSKASGPLCVCRRIEEVAEKLRPGDVLVVLEAMKMEIEVSAPVDGTVKSVAVNVGATVNTDDLLVTLG